mmetsp:Transcript_21609/g.50462  ORF Transcript_21609/g.50462 Transcript_21609/m.50462 type:complete len:475 (+) Transcript_21609:25-1449(+)
MPEKLVVPPILAPSRRFEAQPGSPKRRGSLVLDSPLPPTLPQDPAREINPNQLQTWESDSDDAGSPSLRHKQPSIVSTAVSGTIGSVLAEFVLFPVDKVRLHVQTSLNDDVSFMATAAEIVNSKGKAGLFKGIHVAVIKETFHSFNFWVWHGLFFRRLLKFRDTSMTHPATRLFANILIKQLNWLCTLPFEIISAMNQLADDDPGFFGTAAQLYDRGGIYIFYRALPVTLILAINPAIMHTLITTLLRMVALARQAMGAGYFEAREHSPTLVGVVTAVAKLIATVVTYPLIRVKILQQIRGSKGILRVLRGIHNKEGFRGLYRGLFGVGLKAVLWNSVMMAFKHALGPTRHHTPPGSPKAWQRIPSCPLMGRQPFPVQVLTEEKIEQMMGYLSSSKQNAEVKKRVNSIDRRMEDMGGEVREVRELLTKLVSAASTSEASGDPRSVLQGAIEKVASKERPKVKFALPPASHSAKG